MCDEVDPRYLEYDSVVDYADKFLNIIDAIVNDDSSSQGLRNSFVISFFNEMIFKERNNNLNKIFGKIEFLKKKSDKVKINNLILRMVISNSLEYEINEFLGLSINDLMNMGVWEYHCLIEELKKSKEQMKQMNGKNDSNNDIDKLKKQLKMLEKQLERSN